MSNMDSFVLHALAALAIAVGWKSENMNVASRNDIAMWESLQVPSEFAISKCESLLYAVRMA